MEWINEWMNECENEWINEWLNANIFGCKSRNHKKSDIIFTGLIKSADKKKLTDPVDAIGSLWDFRWNHSKEDV